MADRLFVQRGGETVKALSLDMTLLSIGRTPDNGLALPDPAVAIRHAEVRLSAGGRFAITDLGNADTFLDGRKLVPFQPQELRQGALVQVGPFLLAYLAGEDTPPPPKPELPAPPTEFQRIPLHAPIQRTPMQLAPGDQSAYLQYLPALFSESEFLSRYLMIFQTIWEPLQHRQDHLELYFSPTTAPEGFLGWLAAWLGLEVDPHWPEARRRAWLLEALHLLRWRGTTYGIRRAIELGCGVSPNLHEDPARPHFIRIALPDPKEENVDGVTREGTLRLVAHNLPAWVEYEVVFMSAGGEVVARVGGAPPDASGGTPNAGKGGGRKPKTPKPAPERKSSEGEP